jgi:hypothetical protein
MNRFYRLLLALLAVTITMSCESGSYRGDGTFTDNGKSAASWRYVLTLDDINLDRKNTYTFHLLGLPSDEYLMGFAIQKGGLWAEENPPTTNLHIRITDANGSIVAQSDVPFNQWAWSVPVDKQDAFVYVAGPESRFTASVEKSYTLKIGVDPTDTENDTALSGTFELRSQGWK